MTTTPTRVPAQPAPGTPDDERRLLAAAARALREAGWSPDRRSPALWRPSRWLDDHHGITWTTYPNGGVIEIWRRVDGAEDVTDVFVTSVAQVIDVVAALTGVGQHLTTGGRRAAELERRIAAMQAEARVMDAFVEHLDARLRYAGETAPIQRAGVPA